MTIAINIITTILLLIWVGIVMMSPMMVATQGFGESLSAILTAMTFIGFPIIVFALQKIMGWRYFGMEVNWLLIGFSIVIGCIYMLYGFPKMLLNLNNGISNNGYFINDPTVYFNGDKILGAHAPTFSVIKEASQYAKDQRHVFIDGKIINGADPKTFVPLDSTRDELGFESQSLYWADAKSVFYKGKRLSNSDPKSFLHRDGYGWDALSVFYENEKIENVDPKTFKLIKSGIAVAGKSIIVFGRPSVATVDQETFEVIEAESTLFCKDKINVFILHYTKLDPLVKVQGADPNTFKLIERSYAVDKNSVYYCGLDSDNKEIVGILNKANPKTFAVGYDHATNSDARDGTRFYMQGKLVTQKH